MVETKSFRDVAGFGTGTIVMVHDRDRHVYRVQMDGGNHVFGEFQYGRDNSANTTMDEARTRAHLTLDVSANVIRAIKEHKI